jgi:hypothetical protein
VATASSAKKAPAKFSRALAVCTWKTTISLRPRRRSGSRFLAFNHSGRLRRLRQYYFAHYNPVTHCRVVNGGRHVWTDCRQTYNATRRINHCRILRVIITNGRCTRRRSEHEIIRVRCVGDNVSRRAGGRLLGCRCPGHWVCARRCRCGLCER